MFERRTIWIVLFLVLFTGLTAEAQYYEKHYIAPAPWKYFSDANELIVTTQSTTDVAITVSRSDGSYVVNLSAKAGSPAVYRWPNGQDGNASALNTVLKDAGMIVTGTQPIAVTLRNVDSDVYYYRGGAIRGNASLSSYGNPGRGTNFRLGYYRSDYYWNEEIPQYSAMALHDNTTISLNGNYLVTLQTGESYIFRADIGALVTSDKQIVMNVGAYEDYGGGCGDGVYNQIPPINVLGKEYLFSKGKGNWTVAQTTVIATEDNTNVTVNSYNVDGSFNSASSRVLAKAGDWFTFSNGVNNEYRSASGIIADKNVIAYSGVGESCEVDVMILPPLNDCTGSKYLESYKFRGYYNNDLPYFANILTKSASDKIYINGVDAETLVSLRRQIGSTGWYILDFDNDQIGNPNDVTITSTARLNATLIQSGGGYSMAGVYSSFIDQPLAPSVTYDPPTCPITATLEVGSGIAPYQWYLNGNPIPGATGLTYKLNVSGTYTVSSTSSCGGIIISDASLVQLCSDVLVSKTVDNPTPYVGDNVVFKVIARNLNTSTSTNVVVNDLLPSGYTFVSANATAGVYNSSTGRWAIGVLRYQEDQILTITAKVNASGNLNGLNDVIDSLNLVTDKNKEFAKILSERNKSQENIEILKANIDSILDLQINPSNKDISKLFVLSKFQYKKILDSIKTDSYVKTDSVTKKGLFTRLGNALAGKSQIQKEQVNTIITMKYDNKIVTGSIEEQMANIFNTTYDYYGQQFKNLKNNFTNLRNQDARLMELNNRLLTIEGKLLPFYSKSLNQLQDNNQKRLQDRSDSNKIVRSYTIAILIVIMLVLSIIIFSFTSISFQYETRLTVAHLKIKENLNFKNRIVGMISHEIRSPLSLISIYSKMISSSIKDKEIQESFKSIQFTTNSLLLLTNQILEYSKDENRVLKLNKKKFQLVDEIDQIVSSIGSLVESKGNRIEIKSDLDSNYDINSDLIKIHQLFYNLIGNANKFTTNGLIAVTVGHELIADKKLNLKVEIEDNGMGISEEDLKKVFESYYQGTVSESVKDLGVGLGLNLCKEIVELFDGEINIESKIGSGTKVSFNLILNIV